MRPINQIFEYCLGPLYRTDTNLDVTFVVDTSVCVSYYLFYSKPFVMFNIAVEKVQHATHRPNISESSIPTNSRDERPDTHLALSLGFICVLSDLNALDNHVFRMLALYPSYRRQVVIS